MQMDDARVTWVIESGSLRSAGVSLVGHGARMFDASFAPRSPSDPAPLRLATASEDGTVRVWDARKDVSPDDPRRAPQVLQGSPDDEMLRLGWSVDGRRIVAGTSSEEVHIWSVSDGAKILRACISSSSAVGAVVESTATDNAALGRQRGALRARVAGGDYDPAILRELADIEEALHSGGAPSTTAAAAAAGAGAAAAAAPAAPAVEEEREQIYVSSWFPGSADADGSRLLVASEGTCSEWRVRGSSLTCASKWEIDTRTKLVTGGLKRNPNATCYIFDAQFGSLPSSGSSSVLAAACGDGTVRVRDWASATDIAAVGVRDGHSRFTTSCCFAPSGRVVASSSGDGTIMLWDTRMWKRLRKLQAHAAPCFGCAFLPGGAPTRAGGVLEGGSDATLYSWSKDGTVRLWDVGALVRGDSEVAAQLGCIEASGSTIYKSAFAWDESRRDGATSTSLVLALAGDLSAGVDDDGVQAQLRFGTTMHAATRSTATSTLSRKRTRPGPAAARSTGVAEVAAI